MGIFSKITGIFRRKKKEPLSDDLGEDLGPPVPLKSEDKPLPPPGEPLRREPLTPPPPAFEPLPSTKTPETESIDVSNIKAKLDLLLTQIENVKIQNKNVEERLKSIEKMLAEMKGIRYY